MRQRVELARALAGQSDVLLLDEPFSALDYQTRLRLRRELARLLALRPRTVIFVTHDIEEAAQLADRVLVLTERPARIRTELRLTTPRPRDLTRPTSRTRWSASSVNSAWMSRKGRRGAGWVERDPSQRVKGVVT